MKRIPLSEVKDDLSRYLREAEKEEVVITRHGKPAGILIGFGSEDDWFDYRLEPVDRTQRFVGVWLSKIHDSLSFLLNIYFPSRNYEGSPGTKSPNKYSFFFKPL